MLLNKKETEDKPVYKKDTLIKLLRQNKPKAWQKAFSYDQVKRGWNMAQLEYELNEMGVLK
tara:strand:- start:1400 stop:1582 length:183 start_codon:yes stop_codon:yes gene_type:complete